MSADIVKLWGKIWSTSHDVMTMFLAFIIWLGWYDKTIREAAFIAGLYQALMFVFDICWIKGWANTDSKFWTLAFFILIFIMNFILISNGRHIKK